MNLLGLSSNRSNLTAEQIRQISAARSGIAFDADIAQQLRIVSSNQNISYDEI